MKKMISMLAALSLSLVFSAPVKAAELNPWTDCGIGAMIFTDTPVAAVISNVIWDLGTTAVTSAGLSKNTCGGKNAKVALFIGTTYANLEEETVQGDGRHVRAMLNILSCESAAQGDIIQSVRADFARSLQNVSYSEKSAQAKAETYYNVVLAKVSGEFASQCQSL
ncbi:MAG: DUF3015 family protein [Pseudomonadota bacterium]